MSKRVFRGKRIHISDRLCFTALGFGIFVTGNHLKNMKKTRTLVI